MPVLIVPESGASSPRSIFMRVDFPAPLGPRTAILSPLSTLKEKSFMRHFPPRLFETFSPSKTIFPESSASPTLSLIWPMRFLLSANSRRISLSFFTLPAFRVRRALMPFLIQISSSESLRSKSAFAISSFRSSSSFMERYFE